MADERTLAFYGAEAARYARWAHDNKVNVEAFAARLAPGAHILDLGCGGGQDSAAFKRMGFQVTPMDATAAFVSEAKQLHDIDVRVMRFGELEDVATFDAIWAAASLHHEDAGDLPDRFARMQRALKPGGLLRASLKEGDAPRRDKFGRYYCAMDEAALRHLAAGWDEVEIARGASTGYAGEPAMWLTLHAVAPAR